MNFYTELEIKTFFQEELDENFCPTLQVHNDITYRIRGITLRSVRILSRVRIPVFGQFSRIKLEEFELNARPIKS